MHKIFNILVILIIAFTIGCHQQNIQRHTYWKPTGEEFDSLTEKLEWQFNVYAPYDSIQHSITQLESIIDKDSSDLKLRMSRIMFWRSKYLERLQRQDSAIITIQKALSLNDSIEYEYDRLRMLSLLYSLCDTIDGAVKYKLYEYCIEYSRKSGDIGFEAYSAQNMGILLSDIDDDKRAMNYLILADSLNSEAGYHILSLKNKINKSISLRFLDKKEASDSILLSVMQDPELEKDTFDMNIIPINLFASTDSIKYLYQAYARVKDNPQFRHLKSLCSALLVKKNIMINNIDSISYYETQSMKELPYVNDYYIKTIVWFNQGLAQVAYNNSDSALICRIRSELYADSLNMKLRSSEVLRLSALHEIKAMEKGYEEAKFRQTMFTVFVILLLIVSGAVVALILNRRHMRARMLAMEKELELEKTRKKITATTLSIQEKDQLLDVLKTELEELRRGGEIKEQNARKLESTIKSHLLEHDSEETFRNMFDTVNPNFTRRLRERCPGIADSYVNLACYILMELDNKKIARLMNIKPESVHQSRWRLRQRLNLAEGETLEDTLRRLNDSSK